MQPMSWNLSRLGSRFGLLFEPHRRRVMHGALGRFLDEPLDLAVGLVEPDGTRRVMPFTKAAAGAWSDAPDGPDGPNTPPPGGARTRCFYNVEQFDRVNSITFRGFAERYRLRFEFNVHAPFYPQDRRLCITPVFYLEMRVHPMSGIRHLTAAEPTPGEVELFIEFNRPRTDITVNDGVIDLAYDAPLVMERRDDDPDRAGHRLDRRDRRAAEAAEAAAGEKPEVPRVGARERITSLNDGATAWTGAGADPHTGAGLRLRLPVTPMGSGTKWRMVWAAHVADPVLTVGRADPDGGPPRPCPARFAYTDYYDSVGAVTTDAIQHRDDRLALSRLFERTLDQAPLDQAQHHLLNQSFQNYLLNTFWCTGRDPSRLSDLNGEPDPEGQKFPWFSVWEGSSRYHSTLDVEYNACVFHLTLWPDLLRIQLRQWAERYTEHAPSRGAILAHDLGSGTRADSQVSPFRMEVEENSNYLLMLQAYCRWTGDTTLVREHSALVRKLTRYLIWTDRDGEGFPTLGTANTFVDAGPAMRFARKQTYLAVKRLAALRAAADCIRLASTHSPFAQKGPGTPSAEQQQRLAHEARQLEARVEKDAQRVERAAWLGDHYAVACDDSALELDDPDTDAPPAYERIPGCDAYSIHTANALLLPAMIGQPPLLDRQRLKTDLLSSARENRGRYASSHTSDDPDALRISGNLWRDMFARYLGMAGPSAAAAYWDMQVMSNTGDNSMGFTDAYIKEHLTHYPRGIVSLAYFLATPRLVVDRLAPGGAYITVEPDRHMPQRWPLLPLADWAARKIPVCVVRPDGTVRIESPTDPVIIHGADPGQSVSGLEMIG